jgi:predicted transcriptional regulator
MADTRAVMKALEAGEAVEPEFLYSFPSWEALHRMLTPKRLEIVRVMAGQASLSVDEIARRVGRDVAGVESDVNALRNSGIIDKAENGGVEFPYDRLHFDLEIEAAA